MRIIKHFFTGACPLAFIVALSSCGNVKKLQYMQGSFDTAKLSNYQMPVPVIQKGDILSIMVYSDNIAATAIYNQPLPTAGTGTGSGGGYLVNEDGNIQFQGLGNLHVEGLTKTGLTLLLNSKLSTYLQNPYYAIRFINYKVTIIGDVAKPAVYTIPGERVSVLEAIGLAGDLNITARRDNIRIIREEAGKREFGLIDLRQPDLFNNKFYQLHQNDVVYVDFNKGKAAASDQTTVRNVTIGATLISTIAIIISIIRR